MSTYNKLLLRQIKRKYGDLANIPPEMHELLNTISKTYDQHNRDQKLIERAMELSSQELTETNERLFHQADELERSNAELKQFAVIAAHDLKEPLRTIASFVQLIIRKEKEKLSSESEEYAGYVVQSVNRMADLLDGLLDYSVVGRQNIRKNLCIKNIVNDVKHNLFLKLKENNASVTILNPLPCIYGNSSMILQLFLNLIDNSIKFKKDNPPDIRISSSLYNQHYYQFTLNDNGIGIKKEYAKKIFLIFERLHNSDSPYKGTGVGLAVCKKIVESHNGKMWVNTNYTDGFSISFTLPKAQEKQKAPTNNVEALS